MTGDDYRRGGGGGRKQSVTQSVSRRKLSVVESSKMGHNTLDKPNESKTVNGEFDYSKDVLEKLLIRANLKTQHDSGSGCESTPQLTGLKKEPRNQ